MSEFLEQEIAVVITVCGEADDGCPLFPGKAVRHHWGFADPGKIQGTEADVLREFRRVRDEMLRVFNAHAAGLRDAPTLA